MFLYFVKKNLGGCNNMFINNVLNIELRYHWLKLSV